MAALQTEYSLMNRDPEHNGLLETCEELGIGFVPWGPVGMGYLTPQINTGTKFDAKTDLRSGFDRFSPESIAANRPLVDRVKLLAEKKKVTSPQLSLAWLLAQKPFIVPIPGTLSIDHLYESVGAINIELAPEDLREIAAALSTVAVHGGRMNEAQMTIVEQ